MKAYADISQLQKKIDEFQLGPIDLRIEPCTITALVGNNGSGKSTLLKLMMNLANPDFGNIKLFDQFVYGQDESWKRKVSYQPQTVVGYSGYTGKDLKTIIASLYPEWDEALFNKIIDIFNLPLTKKYGKLSQGNQQKMNLALTLPRNTWLTILDEPTSFMDIPAKKQLMDLLVEWMERGDRALLIATHQADDIRKLADYITVLNDGNLIGTYEKEELTSQYAQFWFTQPIPEIHIPGEIMRNDTAIITNQRIAAEDFLKANNIYWSHSALLELEEIITLLLTNQGGSN